ncbi:hypothetical protein PENSPDRAFT_143968 [Peniophora sp. CONT]|nr:hypothetical protein PENSPDRAFT_143968 [Peniophora sp. CONT]
MLPPAPAGAVASLKREEGVLGEVSTSPSPKKRIVALPSEHGVTCASTLKQLSRARMAPSTLTGDLFGLMPGALGMQTRGLQRANSSRSIHEGPTGDVFGFRRKKSTALATRLRNACPWQAGGKMPASTGHDLIHPVSRSYRRTPTPACTARRCRSRHPALCFCGPDGRWHPHRVRVYRDQTSSACIPIRSVCLSNVGRASFATAVITAPLLGFSEIAHGTSRRLVAQSPRPTWQSICYFLRPSRPSPASTPEKPRAVCAFNPALESLVVLGLAYAL